jgi:hypothetical protein
MKRVLSLAEIEWITTGVRQRGPTNVSNVAHCIPPVFPAYAKLFHPINEDISVQNDEMTWHEEEKSEPPDNIGSVNPTTRKIQEVIRSSTLVYGGAKPNSRLVRIRWEQLARRLGLQFSPTLSSWSFTRQFSGGSWPRHLVGPAEGNLDGPDRDALISILQRHTKVDRCFFHVWLLATFTWTEDLLFEGPLEDASLFPDAVDDVRLTPTHWFPEDRSWLVCTDYDLTFTLIGGSEGLVRNLLESRDVECLPVNPETRIDRDADVLGGFQ